MTNKILKHESPNILIIALGILVSFLSAWYLAVIYFLIVVFSFFWMGRFICTHCSGFGNDNCPSFYGKVAGKIFKKIEKPNFEQAYHRNIPIIMLEWILPMIFGIVALIFQFDVFLLSTEIIFVLIAFIWLPMKIQKDCAKCAIVECPHKQSLMRKYKISPI